MDVKRNVRSSCVLAALVFCGLTTSCGSSSRVVYDAPVGRLIGPRIALLPVVLQSNVDDPSQCMDFCDPENDAFTIALQVSDHLTRALHYDVVCLSYACEDIVGNPFGREDVEAWADEFAGFLADETAPFMLPPDLLAIARRLNDTFGIDGVVVIHGRADYVKHADMAHWMATLTVSMYRDLFRGNTADISVDVFDAETGERTWASRSEATHVGNQEVSVSQGAPPDYGQLLFAGLPGAPR